MSFDAVLLASFGGPEGPDEVVPFLERVTAGRGIPPERLVEVGQHYFTLGGVSPINAQNRSLVSALRGELDARGLDLPVYLGNRNSAPFFSEVLPQIHREGHRQVLAIATSAYSSYSGCRQYREDLARALVESDVALDLTVRKASPYGYLPGFTDAMLPGLVDALTQIHDEGGAFSDVHVFFTTHSIPHSMVAASGPPDAGTQQAYVDQHLEIADRLMSSVAQQFESVPSWSLVYQSRSGPPSVPWLEPDINDALRTAAANGIRSAIVVPIGFISDHIEVVWDLDTQARETADGLGMDFVRVATAGTSSAFVSGLVDVIEQALAGTSVDRGPLWSGLCTADCCLNPRSSLDVVQGC